MDSRMEPFLERERKLYGNSFGERDRDGQKPSLYDKADRHFKPYDHTTLSRPAILGENEVQGIKCRPAFSLAQEALKTYTPEWASGISTVPAETGLGSRAKAKPLARGQGVNPDVLLRIDQKRVCPVTRTFEITAKAKAYRVEVSR